ncbi:MAG: hypothetical protein OXP11_02305 [Gammaproteobacteria bacterium]|nr:hypothetical protein [Gammaproteobacteria bacterium]
MRLCRLRIHALPGIEPGFTFEPPDAGVVLVTGPNAIGKSSLARALKYLLAPIQKTDPVALSLEAEFDSDGTHWKVSRNGSQVLWMRDGEATTAPHLPSGDQINLYRLSMESLLTDDCNDQALAEEIWRALRGGFDLDALHTPLGNRWGRREENALSNARAQLGTVERRYAALQADEAKLQDLEDRIQAAKQASEKVTHLEQAAALHEAIREREVQQATVNQFPPDMDKLKGNELERLEAHETALNKLRKRAEKEQHQLQTTQAEWQECGLAESAPQDETMSRIGERLNALDLQSSLRARAEEDSNNAQAALTVAQAQFNGGEEPPNLSPDSLDQARKIIEPLVDAEANLRELKQQLKLAGEPPDDSEIVSLSAGAHALRAWLAAMAQPNTSGRETTVATWFTASALAIVAALVALVQQNWGGLVAVAVAALGLLLALVKQARQNNRAPSPMDEAKKAFANTGLEPPGEWSSEAVGEHLRRYVEHRLNELTVQRERASGAPHLRTQIERKRSDIKALEEEKSKLAKAIGFNPDLAGAPFHRLVEVAHKWDQARSQCEKRNSALEQIDSKIAAQVEEVRGFLEQWRTSDAPPLDCTSSNAAIQQLRIAFNHLKGRVDAANKAQSKVNSCQQEIKSLETQIEGVEKDAQGLFAEIALEPHQRGELENRIERHAAWKETSEKLRIAQHDESNLRTTLAEHPEFIAAVEGGEIEQLNDGLEVARRKAEAHTGLIEERMGINTRLDEAGRGHELETATSELDNAETTLADKRDDALRHEATNLLLNEVEDQYKSENEPKLLSQAKKRFEQVTAHEFALELLNDKRFAARDLKQGQLRTLEKLSSGTRMQLLLSLRLAWTEALEQGGESLPLFLDEALTTSDENRFAVMAKSLTRLSEAGERQIFYLSARRHESALWRQATGSEPSMVDLAELRFNTKQLEPGDFQIETPPSIPPPNGLDAATYAVSLGVPHFDPRLEPGSLHLFQLLRDDLELLHSLIAMWRITTLGQLESVLSSNAAEGAIPDASVRSHLEQRCKAARAWTDLWRQGRGRHVNRAVLEQSGAVSDKFIDQTAELADELQGDGIALINALRQGRLKRFRTTTTDELEQWLADEGYTDNESILSAHERCRQTLVAVAPPSEDDAADVNQFVSWLETGLATTASISNA